MTMADGGAIEAVELPTDSQRIAVNRCQRRVSLVHEHHEHRYALHFPVHKGDRRFAIFAFRRSERIPVAG